MLWGCIGCINGLLPIFEGWAGGENADELNDVGDIGFAPNRDGGDREFGLGSFGGDGKGCIVGLTIVAIEGL